MAAADHEPPKGPVLVDTGWPSDEAWDSLVAGVRETGHDIGDVVAVLVTHFHADHSGLAHRVREASGAWIGMHEADARALTRFASVADFMAADRIWLARRGVPAAEIDGMRPPVGTDTSCASPTSATTCCSPAITCCRGSPRTSAPPR